MYTIDSETGVIRFSTSGDPSLDEQREQWRAALADPAAARPLRVLDDRRGIASVGVRADVLQISNEAEGMLELLRNARFAFVAGKPATFGMTRMFESHAAELPFEARAFYDPEEAEASLERP